MRVSIYVSFSLKRGDRGRPEEQVTTKDWEFHKFPWQVLMRALRDFNLPKIVAEDSPVFLGLISDLFPNLDVPRSDNVQQLNTY